MGRCCLFLNKSLHRRSRKCVNIISILQCKCHYIHTATDFLSENVLNHLISILNITHIQEQIHYFMHVNVTSLLSYLYSVCPTSLPWEQTLSPAWGTKLTSSWWRLTRSTQDSSMWVGVQFCQAFCTWMRNSNLAYHSSNNVCASHIICSRTLQNL